MLVRKARPALLAYKALPARPERLELMAPPALLVPRGLQARLGSVPLAQPARRARPEPPGRPERQVPQVFRVLLGPPDWERRARPARPGRSGSRVHPGRQDRPVRPVRPVQLASPVLMERLVQRA